MSITIYRDRQVWLIKEWAGKPHSTATSSLVLRACWWGFFESFHAKQLPDGEEKPKTV